MMSTSTSTSTANAKFEAQRSELVGLIGEVGNHSFCFDFVSLVLVFAWDAGRKRARVLLSFK